MDNDVISRSALNAAALKLLTIGYCANGTLQLRKTIEAQELDLLISNAPALDAVPKWISVEERLPPREHNVLVVNGHGYVRMRAFWKKEGSKWTWISNNGFSRENDITHWMPLPEPPEKKRGNKEDLTIVCYKTKPMHANKYQELAMRTCSIPYEDKQDMMIHATTGLASEAGEFAGLMQKTYQGHAYDTEHALKELGDCLWMIAEACTALDVTMEDVMRMNIDKLRARYPEGFDPEKSLHRKAGDV